MHVAWLLVLASAAIAPTASADPAPVYTCQDRVVLEITDASSALVRTGAEGAWVEELGQDLIASPPDESAQLGYPPRLGVHLLPGASEVRLLAEAPFVTRFSARVHCGGDGTTNGWFAEAIDVSKAFGTSVGAQDNAVPASELDALDSTATAPVTKAFGVHLRAQASLAGGKTASAADGFLAAVPAWQAANDHQRAAAALAGAAEEMVRSGRYADAIALAEQHRGDDPAMGGYYAARLAGARCLALRYGRDIDAAAHCYEKLTSLLARLDEPVELAAATLDFATIELDRGSFEIAFQLIDHAESLALGNEAGEAAGRAAFFRALGKSRTGRVDVALSDLDLAMRRFDEAGAKRWHGNALLQLSALLLELDLPAEARAATASAARIFEPAEAPDRFAATLLAQARVAIAESLPDQAAALAGDAMERFKALGSATAEAAARRVQAAALIAMGDADGASVLLGDVTEAANPEDRLLLAEAALALRQFDELARHTDWLSDQPLGVRQRLRLAAARAGAAAAQGMLADGLELLTSERTHLAKLSAAVRNPILNDRLESLDLLLRSHAVDLLAAAAADDPTLIDPAGPWLSIQPRQPPRWFARERRPLEQALAAELFPSSGARSTGDLSALLAAALADTNTQPTNAPFSRPAPSQQGEIPEGRAVLAVHQGRRHLIVVLQSANATQWHVVADAPATLRRIQELQKLVSTPRSHAGEITARAADLSARLLHPLGALNAPTELWIAADATAAAAVPWPLLGFAGEHGTLRSASISLWQPAATSPATADGDLHILVAGEFQGGPALPALPAAGAEAELVARLAARRAQQSPGPVSRNVLLAAIARPGAWVHIGTHGSAIPDRIGGSGLWLHGPAGQPDYVGWTELLGRHLPANLVVLNACQLAAEGTASPARMQNFASALVRAGTQNVVAAQWPISDTASRSWLGTFYQALGPASAGASAALAQTRTALQRSRAFRHPFYWAGLVHVRNQGWYQVNPQPFLPHDFRL